MELDGLTIVRGKCQFWREQLVEADRYDTGIKARDRRVHCSCFIDGHVWETTVKTLPESCPLCYRCRYYIRT
jgi:hypothetical protein